MITGVTAVAPSGDGGPVRLAFATAASTQTASAEGSSSAPAPAVAKPESSSAGSSAQNGHGGSQSERSATGAYLATLLAATITGRAPEGARPAKITPERLATLISYLESAVAGTAPVRSEEERSVDVTS